MSKVTLNEQLSTFATRLLLLYLIMWCQPAINAIPTTVPIRIPEINPILFDFRPIFPNQHRNENPIQRENNQDIQTETKTYTDFLEQKETSDPREYLTPLS